MDATSCGCLELSPSSRLGSIKIPAMKQSNQGFNVDSFSLNITDVNLYVKVLYFSFKVGEKKPRT